MYGGGYSLLRIGTSEASCSFRRPPIETGPAFELREAGDLGRPAENLRKQKADDSYRQLQVSARASSFLAKASLSYGKRTRETRPRARGGPCSPWTCLLAFPALEGRALPRHRLSETPSLFPLRQGRLVAAVSLAAEFRTTTVCSPPVTTQVH